MKNKFAAPDMEIEVFATEDVITQSAPTETPGMSEGGAGGGGETDF